jgi:hypothetical protein
MNMQHGIDTHSWYDVVDPPSSIPIKVFAFGCQTLPPIAGLDNKKAPEFRGFGLLYCLSLPAAAELEIIPTQSSPAAFPKYHKQRD